ncbi:hypothetical protein YC2023_107263 [Brassica napus]
MESLEFGSLESTLKISVLVLSRRLVSSSSQEKRSDSLPLCFQSCRPTTQ